MTRIAACAAVATFDRWRASTRHFVRAGLAAGLSLGIDAFEGPLLQHPQQQVAVLPVISTVDSVLDSR